MKKYLLLAGVLGIITAYFISYQQFLLGSNFLLVSFLDVGQGDAIYIRAPNGNDVLIDGGPDLSIIHKLREAIPRFDRDIDMIIATHPDKDHIAGLSQVFEDYTVRTLLKTEVSSDTSFDRGLLEHAEEEPHLETIFARRGQRIILDKKHGIFVDVLFPDQDTSQFKETNEASIVTRLIYQHTSFLFTGDSPIAVEQFLARNDKSSIQSTVLKLGHHGSNTSTSDEYLDVVQPIFAIVSAGENNSYHHPHPSVVTKVTRRKITLLSTIQESTLSFETDGKSIWRK